MSKRKGVSAVAWFYAQPGFHVSRDSSQGACGPERAPQRDEAERPTAVSGFDRIKAASGEGPHRGGSVDQTQRAHGPANGDPGVPVEMPDEAVNTVTAGETATHCDLVCEVCHGEGDRCSCDCHEATR